MPLNEILIAPFFEGQRKDVDSWVIPDEAFDELENVYLYRGIIHKRPGYAVFGRVGIFEDDEDIGGGTGKKNYTGTLAQVSSTQTVAPGTLSFYDSGGGTQTITDDGDGTLSGNGSGTINYTTGVFDITFTSNTVAQPTADYHYYSTSDTKKIRGIFNFESASGSANSDELVVCDRNVLSTYNTTGEYFSNVAGPAGSYTYFSNNTPLFKAHSWKSKLYLTDGVSGSGIWTYDGSAVAQLTPQYGSNSTNDLVSKCLEMRPYYRRMLCINTIESTGVNTPYPNRIRWSQIDAAAKADWRSDIPGEGGGLDAATNEAIIATGLVRNTLIVAFERSIWAFEYTGSNPPFKWRRIDGGFEINASYSVLELEDMVVFFGENGLYACDGNRVQKLNEKIPQYTYENVNLEYVSKICSVFDENKSICLMSHPSTQDSTENDKTLVFSNKEGWFSTYDYGMHSMGHYIDIADDTWEAITNGSTTWSVYSGLSLSDITNQAKEYTILGGSDSGYIYTLGRESSVVDEPLSVSTAYNFSIKSKTFSPYVGEGMRCRFANLDALMSIASNAKITIDFYSNEKNSTDITKTCTLDGNGSKNWKRIRANNSGNNHSFHVYLSDDQMADATQSAIRHQFHAFRLGFAQAGRIRPS